MRVVDEDALPERGHPVDPSPRTVESHSSRLEIYKYGGEWAKARGHQLRRKHHIFQYGTSSEKPKPYTKFNCIGMVFLASICRRLFVFLFIHGTKAYKSLEHTSKYVTKAAKGTFVKYIAPMNTLYIIIHGCTLIILRLRFNKRCY